MVLQIELVVNKLKERTDRILVIIPHAYTQKMIPNSTRQRNGNKKKGRRSVRSKEDQVFRSSTPLQDAPYAPVAAPVAAAAAAAAAAVSTAAAATASATATATASATATSDAVVTSADLIASEWWLLPQRILDKLEEDGMLFVVPSGANDDWYWMYATLYEGRKTRAYVVSNDLMRDHKIAFLHPRPFVRWRTSQIVYFGLSKASEANDTVVPDVYFYGPSESHFNNLYSTLRYTTLHHIALLLLLLLLLM